jgi:hypothetical protein
MIMRMMFSFLQGLNWKHKVLVVATLS